MIEFSPLSIIIACSVVYWWQRVRYHNHSKSDDLSSSINRDYIVGLNYLLNEQDDKALELFINLLEVDSDTIETHLALGSLFRRRGEVDRAIRIHQNLIARPQLTTEQKLEALQALGRDYMSAGVLDRAERVFQEVVATGEKNPVSVTGLKYLLDIYQQEKAWAQAAEVVKKLEAELAEPMHRIAAHHYCELAEVAIVDGNEKLAKQYIKQAYSTDKLCPRASLLLGNLEFKQGRYKSAIKAYQRVETQDPDFISETILPIVQCYEKLDQEEELITSMKKTLERYPRISILLVLADRIKEVYGAEQAIDFFTLHLSQNPTIRGLIKLIDWHIDTTNGKVRDKLEVLRNLMNQLLEDKPIYRCSNCGFGGKILHWLCPGCKQWSTVKPIHGLEGD